MLSHILVPAKGIKLADIEVTATNRLPSKSLGGQKKKKAKKLKPEEKNRIAQQKATLEAVLGKPTAHHLELGPNGWNTDPIVRIPNKKPTKAELAEREKTESAY